MTNKLKLQGLLALCVLLLGFTFNLLFSKAVLETAVGKTTLSTLELPLNETLAISTPWYQFLLPSQNFYIYKNEHYVLIQSSSTHKLAKPVEVSIESISSPYVVLAVCFLLILIANEIRSSKKYAKRRNALKALHQDVNGLLTSLDIQTKDLRYGSTLAQISHSIHTITDSVNRIKTQTTNHIYQDKLTELIDRHAYIEHLDKQLKYAEENKLRCGLLFIDLDGFKQVNDSFGHSFGDEILIQVANRLKDVVRQYKIQDIHPIYELEQNLSRLGGDEFSIFVPEITEPSFCTELAQTILSEIERDFVLGNKLVKIGASIGIASYPDSASQPHALLQMADVAMYRAKSDGRGIFRVYSPEMGNKMRRYHYLLEELRLAIASQNFHMSFQPIVHVEDCSIDYFEALVRWHHPIEGLIPPSEFIPIAEESNLILELGDWILLESCRQMSAWHNAGMKKVRISVNVSGIQLKHRNIYHWVMEALEKTGLPASSVMLEITESILITASETVIEQLEQCRKEGIRIAIDDFGTGFSSLSTLADLPIDVIKIDKLFITQANENPKYYKILNSISELGHQLGLKIVAEGVEHIEQFELVKNMGIGCVQGYLVSRPETSHNVGTKVLRGNVNHIATTGTSVWLPEGS